ncbi:MAG TPA: MBL fold metallo-hydrolase [Vicinamibacterales bacterium]|nr:MBL fold metallo-hydrolase [Vicinamibacterales bacterium]
MILPLHAANPSAMTGTGNWTYFLPGRHPVLIDAGVGDASHLEEMARARREGPGHVLVTHAHSDHISGVTALARRWPDIRFSKMPWPDRDAKHQVPWHALADGEAIPAGDAVLQAVHTPGHAPDHLAFWHPSTRTVLSGDLVVAGTTVVIPASMGGSLTAYLSSLEKLLSLDPVRLLPAHGEPIEQPDRIIRQYIAHRHEREQQVIAALASGLRTAEGLVHRIYVGLEIALVPMARESVLAHLHKLEDDRVVRREGQEWALY